MSFELLPGYAPWLYAFVAFALVVAAVSLGAIAELAVRNRKTRVARHESIRTYYGRLTLSH
ncbi:MAG: hypothetical protein Q8O61_01385 [Nocardioides sp.]|nr:hypothetical protein [Nocardioides sp.]